jgi:hypothetical protein
MAKRVIAGNPFPTLMTGMTNTLNYKGFLFYFSGRMGASIYNSAGIYQSVAADYFDNQTVDQLNRWQNPGDITNAKHGCMEVMEPVHQPVLDKSDFIRLRNLTLGYSLNNKMIEDMGMSSVRLYLTGVNLLTFTKYSGYEEPEEMMQELEKSFILHHQPKQSL